VAEVVRDSSVSRERRRHERYELLAQVRVKFGKLDYVLELGNLSRSGALLTFGSLKKPGWLSLDKVVEVGIIHPESGDTVELSGTIVRVHQDAQGHGFAVEFSDPEEDAARGLLEVIELAERSVDAPAPKRPPARPPPLPQKP
jgi:hypothetical protein